jgi:polysaccharide pyruvyl transferase WcaK-like protein
VHIVGTVPNARHDDLAFVQDNIRQFDLLIVNGEGTMHHDSEKALSLCRAAAYAAGRGKATALINTVWQANNQLNDYLAAFHLVAAREPNSQTAIARTGCPARLVPDLVFHSHIPGTPRGGAPTPVAHARRTAVIDSVDRGTTLKWAWRALLRGHGLFVMHPLNLERLARRPVLTRGLAWRVGSPPRLIGRHFADQLGAYDRVISGRFHGCCLAMLLGLPVLGLPSNTHKIEGLFHDAGLGNTALITRGRRHEVERRFEHVQACQEEVRQYISTARTRIDQLFNDIAQLAADARAA